MSMLLFACNAGSNGMPHDGETSSSSTSSSTSLDTTGGTSDTAGSDGTGGTSDTTGGTSDTMGSGTVSTGPTSTSTSATASDSTGGGDTSDTGGTDGPPTCNDGIRNQGETDIDCGGPCLACTYPDGRSFKRGAAYNFCDWEHSRGQDDIDLLIEGTTPGSGLTWYYNWGVAPNDCVVDSPDLDTTLEFVPMAWGLTNAGSACASGGACFVDGLSRDEFLARIPASARYLLGFNEPNFAHQSNLTPSVAARAWPHLEYVADARDLLLVGPAVNFCDPTPSNDHAGSCTQEPATRTYVFPEYEETFAAGYRYNVFEWTELFYDECSSASENGHACRIDHQAGHVYSYWSLDWFVTMFERKAGIEPPTAQHCSNGMEDEDEFDVDCGGQECVACSAWARAQFAKSLWLTEFAPSTDDAGGSPTHDERIARTHAYIDTQVPLLESDAYVFRYAWFMPKTTIASLDHVDLLTESMPVERTAVGINYLDEAHE